MEIPVEVAKEVSRPPAIMIVTGEVFYAMVALHGDSSYRQGEDHGYHFSIKEVFNYIRFATLADNRRVRFNPLVYFILAVHQKLNPAIPKLARVMMESQASKGVAIKYHQLCDRFAQFNTKLVNDRKNQKVSDDRKKSRSDCHRSVSEAESSQTQFPLYDDLCDEEFLDSANRDSNTSRSANRRTQQRSENISLHQAFSATLADCQDEMEIPNPETLGLLGPQSRTSSQRELSPAEVNSAILTSLNELAREALEQRKISSQNQQDAIQYQREKDKRKSNQTNALAGQTEQQRHLLALGLTPLEDLYDARPFTFKELTFSPPMKKLIETKNQVHILNQIDQHMGEFCCHPNKPLWFQWIKSCGFLPPPPPTGIEFGGCTSFMMIQGYLSTTAEEAALKQSLAMQSEGEKSDADLVKLLGESQIVAPITDDQVFQMFHTLSQFFEILAGKKPCIASSGYAQAAELVLAHGRDIDKSRTTQVKNISYYVCVTQLIWSVVSCSNPFSGIYCQRETVLILLIFAKN